MKSKQCKPVLWMCLTLLPAPYWNCRNLLWVWRNRWRVSFRYVGHCPCFLFHSPSSLELVSLSSGRLRRTLRCRPSTRPSWPTWRAWRKNLARRNGRSAAGEANVWTSHRWNVDVILMFVGFFALCRTLSPGCATGWSSRWPRTRKVTQARSYATESSHLRRFVSSWVLMSVAVTAFCWLRLQTPRPSARRRRRAKDPGSSAPSSLSATSREATSPGSAGTPQGSAGAWTNLANPSREVPPAAGPSAPEVREPDWRRTFHSGRHLQARSKPVDETCLKLVANQVSVF